MGYNWSKIWNKKTSINHQKLNEKLTEIFEKYKFDQKSRRSVGKCVKIGFTCEKNSYKIY